jgi:hypothetical protein
VGVNAMWIRGTTESGRSSLTEGAALVELAARGLLSRSRARLGANCIPSRDAIGPNSQENAPARGRGPERAGLGRFHPLGPGSRDKAGVRGRGSQRAGLGPFHPLRVMTTAVDALAWLSGRGIVRDGAP